ncbi:MAG: DHH family phosphoesterase, partial [Planctomycetota bacterium]
MSAAAPQPRSDLLQGACHRWRRAPLNREEVLALAREADLPPVIAALLSSRGAREAAEAHEFLRPSLQGLHPPETLPDIGRGVALIREALGRSDPICIYGDYDADGLTATALLVELLRGLGGDVSTYVPHRLREGYGLHCEAMRRIAASGARLLITVDGGANDHEELALTRQLGMKVIVTDHHHKPSVLPDAFALLNPLLLSDPGAVAFLSLFMDVIPARTG